MYSSSKSDFSSLLALFGLGKIQVKGKERLIPQIASKDIQQIEGLVNEKITDPKEKSDLYSKLLSSPSGKISFDKAIEVLAEEYLE